MNVIDVIRSPEDGANKETRLLFDGPGRKLTLLTLRRGAVVAEHASPDPVIIECVAGAGTLTSGGQDISLVPGRRVVMEAGEAHGIIAGDLLALMLTRCTLASRPAAHS